MIWLELHCDALTPGLGGGEWGVERRCVTDRGDSPGVSARGDLPEAWRRLREEATGEGWRKVSGRWWCPDCLQAAADQAGGAGSASGAGSAASG